MNKKIVILGCGFVGSSLVAVLEKEGYQVYATSREPTNRANRIIFNLTEESTYKNIPADSEIVWTFPAVPADQVSKFYNFTTKNNCRIRIIFGTTSAYLDKQGTLTEGSPMDTSNDRLKSENFLLKNGAVVLQTAGIYGEAKHPFDWLNKGLIKNANKTVNLIHVNDICKVVSKILKENIYGERFNLSDGNKYWWRDLWKTGKERNMVRVECPPELEKEDRLVSNSKLRKFIGEGYNFESI